MLETDLPFYVINLDRRPDRLESITQQFDELGLKFIRQAAVDGTSLPEHDTLFSTARYRFENGYEPSPGEIGCAMSHITIWQKIVNEGVPYAAVIEDDAKLSELLTELVSEKPYLNFDYLKLDYELPKHIDAPEIHASLKADTFRFKDQKSGDTLSIFEHHSPQQGKLHAYECDPVPYYTCGYIISLHGAKRFLNAAKKMYYPIDLLPRYASGFVRQGFVSPAVVNHASVDDSDILDRDFHRQRLKPLELPRWIMHKLLNRRRIRTTEMNFKKIKRPSR